MQIRLETRARSRLDCGGPSNTFSHPTPKVAGNRGSQESLRAVPERSWGPRSSQSSPKTNFKQSAGATALVATQRRAPKMGP